MTGSRIQAAEATLPREAPRAPRSLEGRQANNFNVAMSTADLLVRIAALPPEKREKAEACVDFLAREAEAGPRDPLVKRILGRRERLRAAMGSLENHMDIRDSRANHAGWRR